MTWPEVARAVETGSVTVILPLGATEQHGPHLPLGTDTTRAGALAERVAERLPNSLVAPVLPFGCSDEHADFPGLLGLEHDTLARLVLDIARRLAGWGVQRLVLLTAHGGNGKALDRALSLLRRELPGLDARAAGSLETVAPAVLERARREGIRPTDLGLHAGEGETSELLHLRPDLVRFDRAEPGFTGDMAAVLPSLREHGLEAAAENGVLGDPSRAEAARGASYLDALADDIVAEFRSGAR